VLCLLDLPIKAQETWQQLTFGMTQEQVGQILKAHGMQLTPPDGDHLTEETIFRHVQPQFRLKSDHRELTFLFEPELGFDKNSGVLKSIRLSLKDVSPSDSDQWIADLFAVDDIPSVIEAKYGTPSTQKGSCTVSAEEVATKNASLNPLDHLQRYQCEKNWITKGQEIRLNFGLFIQDSLKSKLLLWIDYKMPSAGL
jgi:hypothetical protein